MSNISTEVKDLSSKIQDMIKVDHKSGTVEVQEDIWEKTLPESLSKDQIKAVKEHESNFIAAGADAVGTMATAAMKKNSDLQEVSATIGMHGHDKVSYNVTREKSYHNPQNPDQEITKRGVVGVNFRNMAGRNAGELKKVITAISEHADKALSK